MEEQQGQEVVGIARRARRTLPLRSRMVTLRTMLHHQCHRQVRHMARRQTVVVVAMDRNIAEILRRGEAVREDLMGEEVELEMLLGRLGRPSIRAGEGGAGVDD